MARSAAAEIPKLDAENLSLADVGTSEENYRKTFDLAELKELAESIRARGVVQAVTVRPWPNRGEKDPPYQLVVGERRRRAAEMAGVAYIPCVIRHDLDDPGIVRELQLIENLQRKNPPPLEEADGFRELHEKHGRSVDEIAERIGVKRGYVYARMKLCALCKAGRDALSSGVFDVSVAIVVARIPNNDLQSRCAKELVAMAENRVLSFETAVRHIHEHYMLRLADATFDIGDPDLVPIAGTCNKCPKRTGAQRELFDEVKERDVCTDPACFKEKTDTAWKLTAAKAEEKGNKIIPDEEAAKLFPNGHSLSYNCDFVDLEQANLDDPKNRKYKQLVPRGTEFHLARDPNGNMHRLIPKKELPELMKRAGVRGAALNEAKRDVHSDKLSERARDQQAAERERQALKRKKTNAVIGAIIGKFKMNDGALRTMAESLALSGYHDALADVVRRRGWDEKGKKAGAVFSKHVAQLSGDELGALVFELVITRGAHFTFSTSTAPQIARAAKVFKIDVKKVEKAAAAELAQEKKEKAAKKGGAK